MSKQSTEKHEKGNSEGDVELMRGLARSYADCVAVSSNFKARITAVARGFGVTWSRARGIYFGDARKIEAWEYRQAKRALELERQRQEAREIHRQFLRTADHLERIDPVRYRNAIDQIRGDAQGFRLSDCAVVETE